MPCTIIKKMVVHVRKNIAYFAVKLTPPLKMSKAAAIPIQSKKCSTYVVGGPPGTESPIEPQD